MHRILSRSMPDADWTTWPVLVFDSGMLVDHQPVTTDTPPSWVRRTAADFSTVLTPARGIPAPHFHESLVWNASRAHHNPPACGLPRGHVGIVDPQGMGADDRHLVDHRDANNISRPFGVYGTMPAVDGALDALLAWHTATDGTTTTGYTWCQKLPATTRIALAYHVYTSALAGVLIYRSAVAELAPETPTAAAETPSNRSDALPPADQSILPSHDDIRPENILLRLSPYLQKTVALCVQRPTDAGAADLLAMSQPEDVSAYLADFSMTRAAARRRDRPPKPQTFYRPTGRADGYQDLAGAAGCAMAVLIGYTPPDHVSATFAQSSVARITTALQADPGLQDLLRSCRTPDDRERVNHLLQIIADSYANAYARDRADPPDLQRHLDAAQVQHHQRQFASQRELVLRASVALLHALPIAALAVATGPVSLRQGLLRAAVLLAALSVIGAAYRWLSALPVLVAAVLVGGLCVAPELVYRADGLAAGEATLRSISQFVVAATTIGVLMSTLVVQGRVLRTAAPRDRVRAGWLLALGVPILAGVGLAALRQDGPFTRPAFGGLSQAAVACVAIGYGFFVWHYVAWSTRLSQLMRPPPDLWRRILPSILVVGTYGSLAFAGHLSSDRLLLTLSVVATVTLVMLLADVMGTRTGLLPVPRRPQQPTLVTGVAVLAILIAAVLFVVAPRSAAVVLPEVRTVGPTAIRGPDSAATVRVLLTQYEQLAGTLRRQNELLERISALGASPSGPALATTETSVATFLAGDLPADVRSTVRGAWERQQARICSATGYASAHGIDAIGPWFRISVDEATATFRFIPSGSLDLPPSEQANQQRFSDHPIVAHLVIREPFWMGDTEVTQGLWTAVMGSNPSAFPDSAAYPVERVSRDDCAVFLQRLRSRLPAMHARLPTEMEWEYACRAGTVGEFAATQAAATIDTMAWYRGSSQGRTHPVKQLAANAWGLYDMHGNVWEWCASHAGDHVAACCFGTSSPSLFTWEPPLHVADAVVRGGDWETDALGCRSGSWCAIPPDRRDHGVGVRLVVPVKLPTAVASP